MGSLVLAPSPGIGPTGVQEWLVVDGQQRLTTLSLLLCAMRDHLAVEHPEQRDRLDELFLINKWNQAAARYKLLPTQADRAGYLACLDSGPDAGKDEGVGAAYRWFRGALRAVGAECVDREPGDASQHRARAGRYSPFLPPPGPLTAPRLTPARGRPSFLASIHRFPR